MEYMAARVGVDKWLFFTTLLLTVVGLAMVFSASAVVAQERFHSEFADVGRQAGNRPQGHLVLISGLLYFGSLPALPWACARSSSVITLSRLGISQTVSSRPTGRIC